jgi:hypothetical protein
MPRLGIGMPLVSTATGAPVLAVQDFFWLNDVSGELTPIHTASRTNLVVDSEELNSTSNVTSSNTTSPDGTLSGLKLNETTSNSQHYGTSYEASVVSGTIYTISFYIKKGTHDLVKVYTQSSRIAAQINITFSTESTGTSGSDVVSGSNFMEDAGNGWYRVGFSATANSTGSVSIYLPPKDLATYVGDVSQYTEYWGAQIEVGSYATSYIPTDGTTVTRVQDLYEKTGISDLINSEEGVLFVEAATTYDSSQSRRITLSDGTTYNRVSLEFDDSVENKIKAFITLNGASEVLEYTASDLSIFNKIAIKWKANDFSIWLNGSAVVTETAEPRVPTGLTELVFDGGNTLNPFYGKVKHLQIYKTALTDPELVTLTT